MQTSIYISIQRGDSRLIIDGSLDLLGKFIGSYIQQTCKFYDEEKSSSQDLFAHITSQLSDNKKDGSKNDTAK